MMTLQPDEAIPIIYRELTPQQRGDDISLNSDEDHTQFTDWIRGNEESDNDNEESDNDDEESNNEDFIPFGLDYEPSSPINLDNEPSSPRYPPPNYTMTIDELDISGIEDDRADGVPPNLFDEDTEDEIELDDDADVGFGGGGGCAAGGGKKKQKQTKNDNKKIKKKGKTTRRNKNKIKK